MLNRCADLSTIMNCRIGHLYTLELKAKDNGASRLSGIGPNDIMQIYVEPETDYEDLDHDRS